jgi:acid stress chaperone HdeA
MPHSTYIGPRSAFIGIGAALLLAAPSALAAAKTGPALHKMTCEEFIALDANVKPKVVYWAAGYDSKGRLKGAVIDIQGTEKVIPFVEDACKAAPKASFWQKLEAELKKLV